MPRFYDIPPTETDLKFDALRPKASKVFKVIKALAEYDFGHKTCFFCHEHICDCGSPDCLLKHAPDCPVLVAQELSGGKSAKEPKGEAQPKCTCCEDSDCECCLKCPVHGIMPKE
jgi:hypothetical protein